MLKNRQLGIRIKFQSVLFLFVYYIIHERRRMRCRRRLIFRSTQSHFHLHMWKFMYYVLFIIPGWNCLRANQWLYCSYCSSEWGRQAYCSSERGKTAVFKDSYNSFHLGFTWKTCTSSSVVYHRFIIEVRLPISFSYLQLYL